MKTIYLIFALFITTLIFAQNRNKLLKEVNTYQYKVCKNTSYQTLSNLELLKLSATYFTKNNFQTYASSDSAATFIKKTTVSDRKTYDMVKHLVYVKIYTLNGHKKIELTDETDFYREPFHGVEAPTNRGAFHLDKKGYYKYMYSQLCGKDVELSEELKSKVTKYNTQQTKEKKKLLKGRDF